MEKVEYLIENYEGDLKFAKKTIKQELEILRRILDTVERKLEEGSLAADDGFQGHEWKLQKELTKFEHLKLTLQDLKR